MDPWLAVLIGILVGCLTGLVPGIHVNLLAAVALTIPGIDGSVALGLVAVGVVHTFVTILPSTYLGAPDADTAMSVLPAHRLLHEDHGPEAVRISLAASMLALIAAITLWWPYRWLVHAPHVLPLLRLLAPWILLAVPVWLALRARPWAIATAVLSAWLGWIAFQWPVRGIIPGAATPLLPLLSGLFGIPTLLFAMHLRQRIPWQDPAPEHVERGCLHATAPGLTAAMATAILPGLTAAVATAIALPRESGPRRVLATMSAINTAHLCFAMAALWILGKTRSGLAIAWASIEAPMPWHHLPPPDAVGVAAAMLVAGAAAVAFTSLVDTPYRRILRALPTRLPEALALGLIIILVVATTGPMGLLLLATASVIGAIPLAAGVPRTHLAAALSIPIALRLL